MSHPAPYLPEGFLARFGDVELAGYPLVAGGALTSIGVGMWWAVVSCLFCTVVYKTSRLYTPLYFKDYRQMSTHDQRDWDTRLLNIGYAIYIVYWAVRLLALSDSFWTPGPAPMLLRTHPDSVAALGVSVGFFVWELVITVKYWMGGGAMVVHHVGSLACVGAALLSGQGHVPTLWMLSTEATTPFIAARFMLDKAGLKSHPLYVVNGLTILASWTVFRLASFPPFFASVWRARETIPLLNPLSQTLLLGFPPVLFALNTWWYSKILAGVYKVLGGGGGGKGGKADKPPAKQE